MPEAGSPEFLGSLSAPHIGAVFERSRVIKKVTDIRGMLEVPVLKVKEPLDRELWAFRNIHSFSEYTSPINIHWYQAAQDWVLDIRTASSAGEEINKKVVPLSEDERKGASETENLIKAMIAVTASARAMEASAGSMDAYVGALVGDNPDRADTWAEFLVHKDKGKIDLLLKNPVIRWYYSRLLKDAYASLEVDAQGNYLEERDGNLIFASKRSSEKGKVENFEVDATGGLVPLMAPKMVKETVKETVKDFQGNILLNPDGSPKEVWKEVWKCKMIEYLEKENHKGGMREYAWYLYNSDSEQEIDTLAEKDILALDDEVRLTAAKLATDIFLITKYTQWEYDVQAKYVEYYEKEKDPKKRKIELKPSPNWGGNPLRQVIEPSFLPKVIKSIYKDRDEEIWGLVDDCFTFRKAKEANPMFELNNFLVPEMTAPLKHLMRYGQALMALYGGSTAPNLATWDKNVFMGKESIPVILQLMNQAVGDVSGVSQEKDKITGEYPKEDWPYGKDVMGRFVVELLHLKAVAAVRQFVSPTTLELIFTKEDQRRLEEAAEFVFGSGYLYKSGLIQETATAGLGFTYKTNKTNALEIEKTSALKSKETGALGIKELLEKTKNILLLGGEHGKEEAFLMRFFQTTFGIAAAVTTSGGGSKGGRKK